MNGNKPTTQHRKNVKIGKYLTFVPIIRQSQQANFSRIWSLAYFSKDRSVYWIPKYRQSNKKKSCCFSAEFNIFKLFIC